jgi:hypothetical protein
MATIPQNPQEAREMLIKAWNPQTPEQFAAIERLASLTPTKNQSPTPPVLPTANSGTSQNTSQNNPTQITPSLISSGSMVDYNQLLNQTQQLFNNRQNLLNTTQDLLTDFTKNQLAQLDIQKQALKQQIESQFNQQISNIQQQERGVTSDTEAQLAKLRPYAGISSAADNYKASVKAEFQKAYQQAESLKQQAIANVDFQAAQQISNLQQKILENHLNTLSKIDEIQTQALQAYANILSAQQTSNLQQKQISLQEKQLKINSITPQISAILTQLKGKGFDNLDPATKTQLQALTKELETAMELPEGSLFAAYKQIINDPSKNITSYLNQQTGELVTLAISPDGKIEVADKKKIFNVAQLTSKEANMLAVQQLVRKQIEGFYNLTASSELSKLADTIKKTYNIDITPEQVNQIFNLKNDPQKAKEIISNLIPKSNSMFELYAPSKSNLNINSTIPFTSTAPQNPQDLAENIYSTIISSAPTIKKNIDTQKTLEYAAKNIFGNINNLLINNGVPVNEDTLKAVAFSIYDVLPQDLGSIDPSKLSGDALYAYSLLRKYLYLPSSSKNSVILNIPGLENIQSQ